MRHLILIPLLVHSVLGFGQTPDYFANDPRWFCTAWFNSDFPPTENHIYVYYLNGDTLINGFTYHQVFSTGERYYNNSLIQTWNESTGYYLRQQNKSIRFCTQYDDTDSLLVSYDYEVGSSVQGHVFGNGQCLEWPQTIQKIDSVLINTEYRKVFYLDSILGPVITEGVGVQNEMNFEYGEFIISPCVALSASYTLDCFGFGDTSYWDPFGTNGNCDLNLRAQEHQEIDFEIYPNPAKNRFNISSAIEPKSISILSMDGSVRLRFNTKNLEIGSLNPGIYIVEVNFGKGLIRRKKLLVE